MSKQRKLSEMFPLVKSYLRSEVSQVDFCNENHLKVHTFQYWLSKYRQDQTDSETQSTGFMPIQIKENSQTQSRTIKISYPSGVILEIPIR